MWKLIRRGELKEKVDQKNLLVDAMRVSEPNDFQDVRIVTLRQWVEDRAYEEACKQCYYPGEVEEFVEHLLSDRDKKPVPEFVEITDRGIQIGVNVTKINDLAVDRAMALLSKLEDLTTARRIEFHTKRTE